MSTEFLPFALPDITEREIDALVSTIRSGWLTTGPSAAQFEQEMAAFLGPEDIQCIAVSSATAGLHLALEALGIGPGDEVLVPTWTFTSTAEVVRYLGANPVLVDVDPTTLNIDFQAAAAKVSPSTKAIMVVHFAGHPIDSIKLGEFCRKYDLLSVEDAAHAFPVKEADRNVGDSNSDAVVFSFYATKTMTTGEGGMVAVRDPQMAKRMRVMRLHGINRDVFDRYRSKMPAWRYDVVAPGYKYNMTDMSAAIGRVQLQRAVEMRDRRAEIADRYRLGLADLRIELPSDPGPGRHAWHLFVIRVDAATTGLTRDEFIEGMSRLGIGCSVHFIPLHMLSVWKEFTHCHPDELPVASREFERVVSIPIFSSMTDDSVDRVIAAVRSLVA